MSVTHLYFPTNLRTKHISLFNTVDNIASKYLHGETYKYAVFKKMPAL